MRRRPIKGKKSIEQELVARKATVPCRHTTSIVRSIDQSISQSVSQPVLERNTVRLTLLGVFLHSEAYRSEAEHGFNGNHPPPPFPFPFPFSFSFPVESRGWLLSSLHSSSPSSATNEQHGREASKQSEGVGEKWVGCFVYYAFRFFPAWGGIIM
jgi:hypothetical protein